MQQHYLPRRFLLQRSWFSVWLCSKLQVMEPAPTLHWHCYWCCNTTNRVYWSCQWSFHCHNCRTEMEKSVCHSTNNIFIVAYFPNTPSQLSAIKSFMERIPTQTHYLKVVSRDISINPVRCKFLLLSSQKHCPDLLLI